MTANSTEQLQIPLERDSFLRDLIRELTGILEDVVGLEDASGFISVVGQNIGRKINSDYKKALQVDALNKTQVRDVLINLKQRIKGDFYLISESDNQIILGNRTCPFEDRVLNRESLCMMTSNVFGVISADNLGYSKIILDKTIARGDPECRIVIFFSDTEDFPHSREYFKGI